MIRRRAIKRLLLLGGTVAAAGSTLTAWEFRRLSQTPDWSWLDQHPGLLAELCETLLPTTDSPGAKMAGVPAYVAWMLKNGLDMKTQHNCLDGLRDLDQFCESRFGRSFERCSNDEREQALRHAEVAARPVHDLVSKAKAKFLGQPFFTTLRELTFIGLCTSEVGATRALAYDYVPGGFQACLPYANGQKSWATQ